ncbi:MAG: alpha/beta fold hydrolase [Rhodospirillaceae bacterium]|nr:alpha/beta fold hydrolase [Rhodospirillaceae bacterium]
MPLDRAREAVRRDGVADMSDGTQIAYTLYERPGSPGAVLAHSLAMDRQFWAPVAARLEASVLIYDCRGHGASGKPPGPYSVELFADDIAALLDHLGWRDALVAGASMGGSVALATAIRHPARVNALGLVDTTAWYGPEAPKQWAERGAKGRNAGLGSLIEFQTTRWFTDTFRAARRDVVQACVDTFMHNDPVSYEAACLMLGACDLRAGLSGIRVPTAIVVGREDYATPVAMAEALHAGIAGSTLTVIEDGRHLTPLERPDLVAAALARLLPAPQ